MKPALSFLCLLTAAFPYWWVAQQLGVVEAYTVYDDSTWAVVTANLMDPHKQAEYDDFMNECRKSAGEESASQYCDKDEAYRLQMNMYQPRSVRNYTETGFLKIKAPAAVFAIIQEFWEANRDQQTIEWEHVNPYHNSWESPPTILRVDNKTLTGGGPQLQAAISNAAREAMEAWTGMPQASSSVYGIRVYHNQSVLAPHVDRLPLVSSAIINVAQDVDEDWYLEVYDHNGVAHNVTMEPGDLVLYESHSVIHGRPFKLRGNYYANIFVHFEPLGLPLDMPEAETAEGYDLDFPPYLIADSSWMPEWQESNPNGWTRLKDSTALVINGDLRTLQYLGKLNPSKLHEHDGSAAEWRPIHEAARQGNVDILKFLIEEQGANVNELCKVAGGMTPLGLVHKYLGWNHPASEYLLSVGGVKVRRKLVAPDAAAGEEEAESDEEQDQGEL